MQADRARFPGYLAFGTDRFPRGDVGTPMFNERMFGMHRKLLISATLAALVAPVAVTAPVAADPPQHVYHGHGGHYRYHCKRSSGTTGLLAGAGVGGLGAAALGAGPVGLAAGVIGGGLLGRHIDKKHDAAQNRRNGC